MVKLDRHMLSSVGALIFLRKFEKYEAYSTLLMKRKKKGFQMAKFFKEA